MTYAVVDEHARLQEGRRGGRHGGGGNGRRGGARRVLVDDKVVGGGGGGRVAAAEKARKGRREAGSDGASDGSGEHLFPPSSLLSNGEAAALGFTFFFASASCPLPFLSAARLSSQFRKKKPVDAFWLVWELNFL